jgi:D-alanyl-D-alanine carboxypeptidase
MSEPQSIFLEFYKTTLDYRAKVVSIIFASGVAVAIPNIVTLLDNHTKGLNEQQKQQNELLIKQQEQKLKEIELQIAKSSKYQDYVAKFIDQAMNQDIEVRIRFAEYLASVSDEPGHWKAFLTGLVAKRDDLDAKKRQLAEAQLKQIDEVQFTTLSQQIGRLEQQTKAVSAPDSGVSTVRPVSIERLSQVFGRPATNVGLSCTQADNKAFTALLGSETVGKMKPVTMLRPALESLKSIFADMAGSEPALAASIDSAGGLCIRYARGTSRLSSHAFGTAIDLTLDGTISPVGLALTSDSGKRMAHVAEFFERAGWVWGGRFAVPDPSHFEIGADLFESWVREGKLNPPASANADVKP